VSFLNLEDAAKEFGLTRESLRDSARTGKLPGAKKVGGRWFIHRDTLIDYFRQPTCKPNRQHAEESEISSR
jgi:hypothetical protein